MPPLPNGPNGSSDRDAKGRFRKGNAGGPGNPFSAQAAKLRRELFSVVTPARLRKIVESVVRQAEGGDLIAAKLVIERVLGPPVGLDLLERLEKLEAALEAENRP